METKYTEMKNRNIRRMIGMMVSSISINNFETWKMQRKGRKARGGWGWCERSSPPSDLTDRGTPSLPLRKNSPSIGGRADKKWNGPFTILVGIDVSVVAVFWHIHHIGNDSALWFHHQRTHCRMKWLLSEFVFDHSTHWTRKYCRFLPTWRRLESVHFAPWSYNH